MIDQAKRLINIGLPIIPICSHNHAGMSPKHIERCKCAGKTPLIKGWQDKNNTDVRELISWQSQFQSFNIGLPLGKASGYCGIDIDGLQGEEFLQQLSHGDLPDTWEFNTGAGRRLLYQIPYGVTTKKFVSKDKDSKEHEECAILCDGQQTVIPPSVHYTGRKYEWTEAHSPWDLDCAEAPAWLLTLIVAEDDDEFPPTGAQEMVLNLGDEFSGASSEFSTSEFSDEIPPGMTNPGNAVKEQKGKSGKKIVVTEEMLTSVISQGARDNTMTAIVGHYCANRDLRRMGKEFIMNLCQQHNVKYCDPPLEASSIKDKVEYFYQAEMMKDAGYKEQKDKRIIFRASKMATIVRNKMLSDGILLHFDQSSKMYYYTLPNKGPWVCTRNTTLINKWIRKVLITPGLGDASWDKQSYIEETRRALEELFTEAFKQFDDFDLGAHSDDLSKYIVVNNGMLDWKTGELVPWDPNFYTTISFDIEYDAEAQCPNFMQYLQEWLPSESVRKVIQEYVGYCLIPNTRFRKALFMYGKGKNGKSVFLEFLQQFFGEHKATLSYDALFQRFGPANLKDKLVNIFDDTTVTFAKDTGIVKNLVAGGTIAAEFKGRDHFTFTNVARFIFSAQETPKASDHSEAWYDRWIFVKFPNKFRPSNEKKVVMQNSMRDELPGIFNWMVKGLNRLIQQDAFTISEDLDLSSQDYRNQNDSVSLFVSNMCTYHSDLAGESINSLFKVYTTWSELEGLRPLSKKTFTERLEDLGFEKKKGYTGGKSGTTFFKGLIINKESEDYKENTLDYSLATQAL